MNMEKYNRYCVEVLKTCGKFIDDERFDFITRCGFSIKDILLEVSRIDKEDIKYQGLDLINIIILCSNGKDKAQECIENIVRYNRTWNRYMEETSGKDGFLIRLIENRSEIDCFNTINWVETFRIIDTDKNEIGLFKIDNEVYSVEGNKEDEDYGKYFMLINSRKDTFIDRLGLMVLKDGKFKTYAKSATFFKTGIMAALTEIGINGGYDFIYAPITKAFKTSFQELKEKGIL